LGWNVSGTLNLLCLGSERKVKCNNKYFVNGIVFHTKKYGHSIKTYNNEFMLKNRLLMSLKLIIMRS
jgi:hypothetical protein